MNSPLAREHAEVGTQLQALDFIELNAAEDDCSVACRNKVSAQGQAWLRSRVNDLCTRFLVTHGRRPVLRNGVWV